MTKTVAGGFSKELRLFFYVVGLYVAFIIWGYLQEKLTSKIYVLDDGSGSAVWDYPFALNFFMAFFACVLPSLIELLESPQQKTNATTFTYCLAGFTNALASPVGYASLKYITFPMMVLTKSSKPIPVILIGLLFYKKSYAWYKYASVLCICGGITLFSATKKASESKSHEDEANKWNMLIGISLILVNLMLDGFTNNMQDSIFEKYKISSTTMMKMVNLWQCIFIGLYLIACWFIQGDQSELIGAVKIIYHSKDIQKDILLFCACASIGQILIFTVMKEFGSLMWITISITRKLFTILLSIFAFNHTVKWIQWCGVGLVFFGLSLESYMSYHATAPVLVAKKKD